MPASSRGQWEMEDDSERRGEERRRGRTPSCLCSERRRGDMVDIEGKVGRWRAFLPTIPSFSLGGPDCWWENFCLYLPMPVPFLPPCLMPSSCIHTHMPWCCPLPLHPVTHTCDGMTPPPCLPCLPPPYHPTALYALCPMPPYLPPTCHVVVLPCACHV